MAASSKMKHLWKATGRGLSLKQFCRDAVLSEDEQLSKAAQSWFLNKKGLTQKAAKAERIKNKGGLLQIIRQASKSARRKSKSSGGGAATASS